MTGSNGYTFFSTNGATKKAYTAAPIMRK